MHWNIALTVFAAALLLVAPVAAQDDEVLDVKQKPGLVRGDLRITPTMTFFQGYDSNIYTGDTNETADTVTRVAPQVKIETIALPYSLELNGKLEQVWFADETQNHHLNFGVSAKYKYKLDADTTWDAFASAARLHEMPGDEEADPASDASEPLPVNVIRAQMSVREEFDAFNRGFNLTPRIGVSNRNYVNVRRQDGTMINQGARDRSEFITGGRMGFKPDKDIELFIDGEYAPRSYQQESVSARDSDGGSYLAGFKYKPGKDFLLEVAAGYMYRNYDAAIYESIHTPDVQVKAQWVYAPESKVSLNYNRSINEVTETGAGGAIVDDLKLALSHQLLEDLSGRIEGRYRHRDYQGGSGADNGVDDRADAYYGLSFGLKYNLTDATALAADYTFGRNSSNESRSDYTQNVILLSVKAGL